MLQEWPPEVEEAIHNNGIAPADLQCDLPTFIDVACGTHISFSAQQQKQHS